MHSTIVSRRGYHAAGLGEVGAASGGGLRQSAPVDVDNHLGI